jgi:chemotaxis protein MotA
MDIATIIGILAGLGLIVFAIGFSAIGGFINVSSMLIVIGGTGAAILVMFPLGTVIGSIKVGMKAFFAKSPDPEAIILQIAQLAEKGRREGLVSLEKVPVDDEYLARGVRMVADGSSPEMVRKVMETEIAFMKRRHQRGQGVFKGLGAVSPAFGMIGTLVGLVKMLQTLDDPEAIGPAMAVALLTTFYGAVMANLVFIPMAKKLEERSEEETLYMEIILEGILSVQEGEHQRVVQEKLQSFLAPTMRKEVA